LYLNHLKMNKTTR